MEWSRQSCTVNANLHWLSFGRLSPGFWLLSTGLCSGDLSLSLSLSKFCPMLHGHDTSMGTIWV